MNEIPGAVTRWLEQKRRRDRTLAAAVAFVALGGGAAVFLLMSLLVYVVLSVVSLGDSGLLRVLVALGLTAWVFARGMRNRPDERRLDLDPMGYWILRDIWSFGPRLVLEGLRQVHCCGRLGELNVAVCAQALAYLAGQNAAVAWQDLARHCPQLRWPQLREQLALLDGVLFLGEDGARLTLMDPFRLLLRRMLGQAQPEQEPARPRPEPAAQAELANDPEKLSACEILGVSPTATLREIKTAYRKRVKQCHPDLFVGMDQHAHATAERWTKALNTAYATLNPRNADARPVSRRRR